MTAMELLHYMIDQFSTIQANKAAALAKDASQVGIRTTYNAGVVRALFILHESALHIYATEME